MATIKQAQYVVDLGDQVEARRGITHSPEQRTRAIEKVMTWTHQQVQDKIAEFKAQLGAGSGGASQAQMRLGASLQVELMQMSVVSTETGFDFRSASPESADLEIKRLLALKRGLEVERRAQKAFVTDIASKRSAS